MEKMNYPKGLISYTTENALLTTEPGKHCVHHILRPRVVAYSAVMLAMISFFIWRLISIESLELSVLRDRQATNTSSSSEWVENRYLLKIANKRDDDLSIKVGVEGNIPLVLIGAENYDVLAADVASFRVRVQAKKADMHGHVLPIDFVIETDGQRISHESRLIGTLQ